MITGFMGYLSVRKQAYTGKPASAMHWDEAKKRYIIAGEELSDEDVVMPPPKTVSRPKPEESDIPKPDQSGADSLMTAGFGGAYGRGRGRGRGRGVSRATTSVGMPEQKAMPVV